MLMFLKLIRSISGIPFPWVQSRADFASQKVAPALLFWMSGHGLEDLAECESVCLSSPQDMCSVCRLESSHKPNQHFPSVLLSVPGPSLPNSGLSEFLSVPQPLAIWQNTRNSILAPQ